jgi:hypothetical protein
MSAFKPSNEIFAPAGIAISTVHDKVPPACLLLVATHHGVEHPGRRIAFENA